ncbi:ribonuclease M5 [Clostridia bacterium]|nr:ribonuclease M5 [Clostridia bacterium]
MLKIREAVLVEGRYDKHTIAAYVDAPIVTAEGFSVLKSAEKLALLKRLARERGLIILTDSDPAGFLIRNKLKGMLPNVKHAYIPARKGKERRKAAPSKAGLLGVEGMTRETVENALRNAGATVIGEGAPVQNAPWLTKARLFELGLSGGADASSKREKLLKRLDLPPSMSANAMVEVVNLLYPEEEFANLSAE